MPTLGFDYRQSFSHGIDSFLFFLFFLLLHIAQHEQCTLHLFLFTTASHRVKLRKWKWQCRLIVRTVHTSCSPLLARTRTLVDGRTDTTQDVRSVRGVLVPHTWSTLFSSTFRLTMS
jgi:hypothetical protein